MQPMATHLPGNNSPTPRYDDPGAAGPMILSRHLDGAATAIDLGVIWYASDAAKLCAALNALNAGAGGSISYHFRSLYATAERQS